MLLSMLEVGQASSDDIMPDDIMLDDIVELSAMEDMQSMLEDIIELSIMELELCASDGKVADAMAPARRRAPAIRISFFI